MKDALGRTVAEVCVVPRRGTKLIVVRAPAGAPPRPKAARRRARRRAGRGGGAARRGGASPREHVVEFALAELSVSIITAAAARAARAGGGGSRVEPRQRGGGRGGGAPRGASCSTSAARLFARRVARRSVEAWVADVQLDNHGAPRAFTPSFSLALRDAEPFPSCRRAPA